MASEPVECQVLVLRVSIHCEGCKKKVKKVLLHVDDVYRCDIDGRSNKVTVTASRKLDANILVARLRMSGKQAEPWPEAPKQQQQQPSESQSHNDDPSKQNEPAEQPGPPDNAAEPSNGQLSPEPKKSSDNTPKPAQESRDADANGSAGDESTKVAAGHHQHNEAKGKAKQQQQDHQEKPIDAKVTVEFDRGSGSYSSHHHMPMTPQQAPVHVMSYNVARPMASTAYYAAAPAPAPTPMPMARPRPSQGYIDEYAPSNYYSRPASSPYEPYYFPPQPSPYRHQRSPADDDYYYGVPLPPPPPPQRSAFSPPRDAYGDMFNDENANSCSVM